MVGDAVHKRTAGADQALVVSEQTVDTGNLAGQDPEDREDQEICAFVGQVSVMVRGTVDEGDLINPSGDFDDTPICFDELNPGRLLRESATFSPTNDRPSQVWAHTVEYDCFDTDRLRRVHILNSEASVTLYTPKYYLRGIPSRAHHVTTYHTG